MFFNTQQTIIVLFFLLWGSLQAQEAINASGGDGSGSAGGISYSIGQIAWNTIGSSEYLLEGVQQPYEISPSVGMNELQLGIQLFPNPSNGLIQLTLEDLPVSGLRYQLYDIQGQLLKQADLQEVQTVIDLSAFPTGAYLLKASNHQNQFKSFTIIKI
ncbi:MAG: T9SS type A sorting domain-containing protein [Bacteroidetes bacterium]|nr:T9SS type A sorting domain-containing protein [Bacteroidota bacterium]